MTTQTQGLELARTFYTEAVGPLLTVPHAACLIGEGSEILGFDTERSTDHEWGPRMQVLVEAGDVDDVRRLVDRALPGAHRGYPTHWYSLAEARVTHHVEVDTAEGWLSRKLPTIPLRGPDTASWLAAPQQHLLQLTAGAVFHDDIGVVTQLRSTYRWYPIDVWRWMIAGQWHLIGNAEPLLGRVIENEDLRAARVLTGQLCRLIMEMCYLQEARYRPYAKWFGRGFRDLPISTTIGPLIDSALSEPPGLHSDGPLQQALMHLGEHHNALRISEPIDAKIGDFAVNVNGAVRPYPVLNSGAFIDALVDAITDPELRNLPRVGAIDQLTHADDALINFSPWPQMIADGYRALLNGGRRD